MRAFLAIELPEEICQSIHRDLAKLRTIPGRLSWVRPENMHLTLRFLGDTSEDAVEVLLRAIKPAIEGMAPFSLTVAGVGAFPNARRASVIWVGLTTDDSALTSIQSATEAAARKAGFPPETRPFKAHITLGRIRGERPDPALQPAIADLSQYKGGTFEARGVSLFSSELTPRGPVYTRIHEIPLNYDH